MSELNTGKDAISRGSAASEPKAHAAAGAKPWHDHPVDLGITVCGVYLRLIAGRERRSPARRLRERTVKPLSTLGNMLFAGSISAVALSVMIVVALVYSSVLSE